MWNEPAAMDRASAWLLLVSLLSLAWLGGRQAAAAWLPIQRIDVQGAEHATTRAGARSAVLGLQGDFLSLDLEAVRDRFEAMPWVRSAAVRRVWPNRLWVDLREHVPAGAWNRQAVLSVEGEVFPARPWAGLPEFTAPEEMGREVAVRYARFGAVLAAHGWRLEGLHVDGRFAWQLRLANGPTVDLGREMLDERLRRFVTFYSVAAQRISGIRRVDMRYPNGFAVRGGVATEGNT